LLHARQSEILQRLVGRPNHDGRTGSGVGGPKQAAAVRVTGFDIRENQRRFLATRLVGDN
jgi:hypothetical protein